MRSLTRVCTGLVMVGLPSLLRNVTLPCRLNATHGEGTGEPPPKAGLCECTVPRLPSQSHHAPIEAYEVAVARAAKY